MSLKHCIDCEYNCTRENGDQCIVYTGPDWPSLNIKHGDFLHTVLNGALTELNRLVEERIDLQCLRTSSLEDAEVTVPEAVRKLIEFACGLKDTDMIATASLYCLGSNSSVCGAQIIGAKFNWGLSNTATGSVFTYDLSEVRTTLPPEYEAVSANVVVSGKSTGTVGTIINDSNQFSGGITIPVNRFPANVDIQVNVNSPCGQLRLTKTINLTSTSLEGAYPSLFDVEDFSSTDTSGGLTQAEFNERVSAEVCYNKNAIEALRYVEVSNCSPHVFYPSRDILQVVPVNSAKICEALQRITNVGNEMVVITDCDDTCRERQYDQTLQQTIDRYGTLICTLTEKLTALENRVSELELKVEKCCDGNSSSSGSSSGSSGGSGGGCAGGNCGDGNFNPGAGNGSGGSGSGGSGNGGNVPEGCDVAFGWYYNCEGGETGLNVFASGGSGNYTITVNGATYVQGMILSDGTYTLTVTDNADTSCTSSQQITINCADSTPSQCSISIGSYNCDDQDFDVTVSNGAAPYSVTVGSLGPYTYNSDTFTVSVSKDSLGGNGTYNVTVTDSKGCSATNPLTVNCEEKRTCVVSDVSLAVQSSSCSDTAADVSDFTVTVDVVSGSEYIDASNPSAAFLTVNGGTAISSGAISTAGTTHTMTFTGVPVACIDYSTRRVTMAFPTNPETCENSPATLSISVNF